MIAAKETNRIATIAKINSSANGSDVGVVDFVILCTCNSVIAEDEMVILVV